MLRDEINAIKSKDPAIKSVFEVLLYASFWAMLFHRFAHKLYRLRLFFAARLISQISRFLTGIEIHPGATIGKGFFIDHGTGVVIGETCEIGDNVLVYQCVTLGGTGKDTGKRHPTIGNNVMIGSGAKILGPILIGDNVKVGAGSVVLKNVPENVTVVGVPARVSGEAQRPSDTIDQIRIDDPVSNDIQYLKDKITKLEQEISALKASENVNNTLMQERTQNVKPAYVSSVTAEKKTY